jgi:hypothetical protein
MKIVSHIFPLLRRLSLMIIADVQQPEANADSSKDVKAEEMGEPVYWLSPYSCFLRLCPFCFAERSRESKLRSPRKA